jgi:hypothetical protein
VAWCGLNLAPPGLGVPQGFVHVGLRMTRSWHFLVYSGCCGNTTDIRDDGTMKRRHESDWGPYGDAFRTVLRGMQILDLAL